VAVGHEVGTGGVVRAGGRTRHPEGAGAARWDDRDAKTAKHRVHGDPSVTRRIALCGRSSGHAHAAVEHDGHSSQHNGGQQHDHEQFRQAEAGIVPPPLTCLHGAVTTTGAGTVPAAETVTVVPVVGGLTLLTEILHKPGGRAALRSL